MLKAGVGVIKERFAAGKAAVSIIILSGVPGDIDKGMKKLEGRLVSAANGAQASGAKYEVKVEPSDRAGFTAAAEVRGPDAGG